ncbi:F0F1 ATP synthase subunit A [Pseudonocardia spinosispora]|uniref:F0F1 ATP synthase subunit A n=1 Tax=Pseudonocardia spinosispora TaxID=103441 RepID=UPI0003FCB348|nr:F0F1 ATP synthase subunit A [Pseudonocardia spinosispora]
MTGNNIVDLAPGQLVLAAEQIQPGHHPTAEFLGLTFNTDTILSTLVAMVILLGLGLYMARGASAGKPTKLQLIFEMLVDWVQSQVQEQMGLRTPKGVVQLCVTTFSFILIANWLAALPTEHVAPPPTADVNLVYPMTLLVIIWVNVVSFRRKGVKQYFGHLAQPYAFLAPIEFVTQYFGRPVSLALRLWGNIFAGTLMVAVIGQMPAYVLWLPNAGWKLFDMFIGALQALIFSLLTIIYFGEAVEEHEAAH